MIVLERQGAVITAYDRSRTPPAPARTMKRGKVDGFSKKSRRRLFILLNKLDFVESLTSFLTLTYEGNPTPEDARAAFKRFRTRLMRYFPEVSAVWRAEMQQRGVVHFHLLLFNMPFVPWWWLKDLWTECQRSANSRIWVTRIQNRKHALAYVSKYIAKVDAVEVSPFLDIGPYQHTPSLQWCGRAWGWINREALPYAPKERILVFDDDLMRYLWFMVKSVTKGKCANSDYMAMLFSDDARAIFEYVKQHAARWRPYPPGLKFMYT